MTIWEGSSVNCRAEREEKKEMGNEEEGEEERVEEIEADRCP